MTAKSTSRNPMSFNGVGKQFKSRVGRAVRAATSAGDPTPGPGAERGRLQLGLHNRVATKKASRQGLTANANDRFAGTDAG